MGKREYDVIIIGAGPAGLTAGIYLGRAKLRAVILEAMTPGGQALFSERIENYPGFPEGITGQELIERMTRQAESFGTEIKSLCPVETVSLDGQVKVVEATGGPYRSKALIIATGAQAAKLGVPGEERYMGQGVSVCAICDGAFFREKVVAVVGGGDSAVEDAFYLSRMAKKVYLIHRRDRLRAQKILQERLFKQQNVEPIWKTVVKEIRGNEEGVKALLLEKVDTGETRELPVDGIFVAIGRRPATEPFRGIVELDEGGYIVTDQGCTTSTPGIFAAGDVRKKSVRQISTAVGDGAIAAYSAELYLERWRG